MPHTYDYPRPMVTVDVIPFSLREDKLRVLLIRRAQDPFKGFWALPGGFIEMDEPLEASAARELREETSVRPYWMTQLGAYGDPGRDPRGRTVTVAFLAWISETVTPRAKSDAQEFAWHDPDAVQEMAFDHATILRDALDQFRRMVRLEGLLEVIVGRTKTQRRMRRYGYAIIGDYVDHPAIINPLFTAQMVQSHAEQQRMANLLLGDVVTDALGELLFKRPLKKS